MRNSQELLDIASDANKQLKEIGLENSEIMCIGIMIHSLANNTILIEALNTLGMSRLFEEGNLRATKEKLKRKLNKTKDERKEGL